jgi:hypothetical protein
MATSLPVIRGKWGRGGGERIGDWRVRELEIGD